MNQSTDVCDKRFDCPCPLCGHGKLLSVTIAHEAEIKHDGRLYRLSIPSLPVKKCDACGEVFFDAASHGEISQALRTRLNLLSPQQIRDKLATLGLMQKTFAERIRVAPESVSRWLSGAFIQSCAMDQLMRMFFQCEEESRQKLQPCQAACEAGLEVSGTDCVIGS